MILNNKKIKETKEDQIKVISQQLIILKWEQEFEKLLEEKQEKVMELFPVDKIWFEKYKTEVLTDGIPIEQKIENYKSFSPLDNSNILYNQNSINPNSNFVFLNKESIDSFSPTLMKNIQFNIKIIARFLNGKMICKIGKQIYYFFYIDYDNNKEIKEGILMFGNYDTNTINPIINTFLSNEVNVFINNYFPNQPSSNGKFIIFHRNEFDLLLKNEQNITLNKKNVLKKISISNNKVNMKKDLSNELDNSKYKLKQSSPKRRKFMKNTDNSISNYNYKENGMNSMECYNGTNYNITNIIDCINELYYSENMIENFINDRKSQFKIFQLINKRWLDTFKETIKYDEIKDKLSNENNSIVYKKIIYDFLNNNNLNGVQIDDIPQIKEKKEYIKYKQYSYYNDYQLLTKESYSKFCNTFNDNNQRKNGIKAYLLKDGNIFIEFEPTCGEIITYDNSCLEHKYLILSDSYLDEIIENFQKMNLAKCLSFYGVNLNNKCFNKRKLIDKKKGNQKVGDIKFLNNNQTLYNNNDNKLCSDEEIIDNEENVFENEQSGSINNYTKYQKKESYNLIKKKRYLDNINNNDEENEKEDKYNEKTKSPIMKSKKINISKFSEQLNNNGNNIIHPLKSDNLNQSLKFLKSQKSEIEKSPIKLNNYSKKNTGFLSPQPRPAKINLKFSNSPKHNNKIKSKNKSQSNDIITTPPSYNNKKKEFYPSNKIKNKNSKNYNIFPKYKSEYIPNNKNNLIQKNKSDYIQNNKSSFNQKNKSDYIQNNKSSFIQKNKSDYIQNNKSDYSPKYKSNLTTNNKNNVPKIKNFYNINKENNNKQNLISLKKSNNYSKLESMKTLDDDDDDDLNKDYIPGLIGLQNIGATCYMNATLQCFSNVARFREGILKLKNNYSNKNLSYSLKNVLTNLWKNNKIKYYAPYDFKNLISEMNPLFKGIAANDSKDLILFILEKIHKELNIKKGIEPEQGEENNTYFLSVFKAFVNYYESSNESIVSKEFYGYFVSIMKCGHCNITTYNVQIMNILFFPLEKVRIYTKTPYNFVTIEDCFKQYEELELLSGSDQIYCTHCKQVANGYNQNKIIISPRTLIINLNRGKGLEFKVGIKFKEYLDIKKYLLMSDKSPSYYELVGVISHFGENNMGGHFIAYCKNSYDNKWYKFNDAIVTESSFQEASSIGLPYVLYYSYVKS